MQIQRHLYIRHLSSAPHIHMQTLIIDLPLPGAFILMKMAWGDYRLISLSQGLLLTQ